MVKFVTHVMLFLDVQIVCNFYKIIHFLANNAKTIGMT